jgi:hypothetical protein
VKEERHPTGERVIDAEVFKAVNQLPQRAMHGTGVLEMHASLQEGPVEIAIEPAFVTLHVFNSNSAPRRG